MNVREDIDIDSIEEDLRERAEEMENIRPDLSEEIDAQFEKLQRALDEARKKDSEHTPLFLAEMKGEWTIYDIRSDNSAESEFASWVVMRLGEELYDFEDE